MILQRRHNLDHLYLFFVGLVFYSRQMKFGHAMKEHWAIDPSVTYLNHGTVGAPPRCVLEVQQKLRDEIEGEVSGRVTPSTSQCR